MPVDLKSELTRPLALILGALALLGWTLFVLTSVSASSTQKAQRLQIVELAQTSDRLQAELAAQGSAGAAVADLQAKAAQAREDLARVAQSRSDAQAELASVQRSLSSTQRDLSEADRNLQSQNQKLGDLSAQANETGSAEPATGEVAKPSRSGRRRWSRRGRHSRSFSIITR